MIGFLESNFEESESDTYREWITQYMSPVPCAVCGEQRLRPESLAVKVGGRSIAEFTALAISDARPAVDQIRKGLTERQTDIAGRALAEIAARLDFLLAVGLGYLSLDRSAATLSGGEAQRIRLATQIGSQLARRAVRAGRAFHRPARARQRSPDLLARTIARPGQHRARRRAR